MIGGLIRFIGRKIFWKINKEDRVYLQNFHDNIAKIDGNTKLAEKQTKLEKEKIILKREMNFWNRIGI